MTYLAMAVMKFIEDHGTSIRHLFSTVLLNSTNPMRSLATPPSSFIDLVQEHHCRKSTYDFSHKILSFTLCYTRSKPRLITFQETFSIIETFMVQSLCWLSIRWYTIVELCILDDGLTWVKHQSLWKGLILTIPTLDHFYEAIVTLKGVFFFMCS